MSDIAIAIERLQRLPERQARDAAREFSAYLANDHNFPFEHGVSFEQLADMIQSLPASDRATMIEAAQSLAERFELANRVRSTVASRHFTVEFDLDKLGIPDWPAQEYFEAIEDYVVRKIWRNRDGAMLKDSVDCPWNEGYVTLSLTPPSAWNHGEYAKMSTVSQGEFEAIWNETPFVAMESNNSWEFVDTTQPTDASFASVIGRWISTTGSGELVEFTLNGMVLWFEPELPVRLLHYAVNGNNVELRREDGMPPLRFALVADVLVDDDGRRFIRQ